MSESPGTLDGALGAEDWRREDRDLPEEDQKVPGFSQPTARTASEADLGVGHFRSGAYKPFHLLRNLFYFPMLVLKGIHLMFSRGLKQMEEPRSESMRVCGKTPQDEIELVRAQNLRRLGGRQLRELARDKAGNRFLRWGVWLGGRRLTSSDFLGRPTSKCENKFLL